MRVLRNWTLGFSVFIKSVNIPTICSTKADIQHAGVLPLSLLSPCRGDDGKTMLFGRSGLVTGLLPSGLGGA